MISPLTLLLAAATLVQGPQPGFGTVVRGQVKSVSSAVPLRFAYIEVVGGGPTMVVPTDTTGVYVLRNVPPGMRVLRATHIDHASHEVEVFVGEGKEVLLDFDLELRPVKLPPVTTTGLAFRITRDTLAAGSSALVPANVRALESTPGVAELGLAEIAREVPGHEPVDPSDILYVRGGAADLKLVLLDGAPVYAPFHLGGLINPLDQEMLRGATLYLGGAPARYDGGLSYVMDLETRAGRYSSEHASLSVDMLSARASMEGPIFERVSYLAGGRAVHGLGSQPFMHQGDFPYLYADGLVRVDVDLGRYGRIITTGFWNRESVRLDSLSGYKSQAVWGNEAGSFRYRGELAGSNAELTIGLGNFRTQLPVGGVRPLMTDGIARRTRVGLNLDRPVGPTHVHYGLQFDRLKYEYRAWPRPRTIREDSLVLQADGAGEVAGSYFDIAWQASKRVQFRGGVRADVFSTDPTVRLAPRASATLVLSDRASLTLAGGKYRQYVRAADQPLTLLGTVIPDSVRPEPLNIASASHAVLTLDQELGEGIRLGIEGFYKQFEGLVTADANRAQASGLDLWVRRGSGRLTGWLGYSLAWIWSHEDDVVAHENFAGRHLVSAGIGGPLGNQGRFDLRVAYGGGLPYTAIPEPEAPPVFTTTTRFMGPDPSPNPEISPVPSAPNEPYLRVDLQVARTFISNVRGFAFEWTPYFKLLNALDRRDALFYHFDRNAEAPEARPLAPLPIIPVLGFEWKF